MGSVKEPEELPSVVVAAMLAAAILLPEPYGTIAGTLLVALVGAGALFLVARLERWIASAALRAVIAVSITAFFLAHLLAPNGSQLLAAVVGLPLAWLGVDRLRRWSGLPARRAPRVIARRGGDAPPLDAPRRSERPRSRVPPVTGPERVCHKHKDKRIFATEAAAEEFVAWSRRKDAAGLWEGAPMDHHYRCPLIDADHWHVSSKPRRA